MTGRHQQVMIERAITWQATLQYCEEARRTNWSAEAIDAEYLAHTTLLAMSARLKVRDMRDWIHQSVGQDYVLSGIFKKNEPRGRTSIPLPHLLRFAFMDMETAMMFKLTWI